MRKNDAATPFPEPQTVSGRKKNSSGFQDKDFTKHGNHLFEQVTDAIIVSDFKGNLVHVNASLCDMFGYTKEDLLQKNVSELLDSEHLVEHPLRFDLLAAGENVFNERRMVHKDGSFIYVEANAKKISEDRILVIARNINRIKKADNLIETTEAHLQTIFDNTDTIYVLIDLDFRIVSYNRRAARFAKQELLHDIHVSEYFLDYFPVARQALLLSYMKAAVNGQDINYEVNYPQSDGSFNWYFVRFFPIKRRDDQIHGLMLAVSDITAKKILEQQLDIEILKKQIEITDAVITAEENERTQIGLELHDNVNQLLATARIYVAMIKHSVSPDAIHLIEEADEFLESAISEIRKLSHNLVSPCIEKFGLSESLQYLGKTFAKGTQLIIECDLNVDEESIQHKLKLTLYRIAQEQLSNISKHANAKNVHLMLCHEADSIKLSIKDDGVGFDNSVKASGIGLLNIRTRASLFNGHVTVTSSLGNGCELIVSLYPKL